MDDSVSHDVLDIMAKHAEAEKGSITPDTSMEMTGLDSLKMVELIFDLEERFDISIPDPDFSTGHNQQFKTAADVIRVVKDMIREQDEDS
ncbi:MAG: hypothetical protein ISR96_00170 [Nitrospira sp.]|nr:hypothetical protein [bacterium]MBL7047930.1 hypothetical protein [Nitrospira sp.]